MVNSDAIVCFLLSAIRHRPCAITASVIDYPVIQSFRCKETQALFEGGSSKRFRSIVSVAERKLTQLDAAATLDFLRAPPGNHLEALKADRIGQHSIRISAQWRLCFVWTPAGPSEVEIVDYH